MSFTTSISSPKENSLFEKYFFEKEQEDCKSDKIVQQVIECLNTHKYTISREKHSISIIKTVEVKVIKMSGFVEWDNDKFDNFDLYSAVNPTKRYLENLFPDCNINFQYEKVTNGIIVVIRISDNIIL